MQVGQDDDTVVGETYIALGVASPGPQPRPLTHVLRTPQVTLSLSGSACIACSWHQ